MNKSDRLSDADCERMTAAVGASLAKDFAPYHGITPALEFVPRGGTPDPLGCPCEMLDEPDVPDAAGYHFVNGGTKWIKVFCNPSLDNSGTALQGRNAISVTLDHEIKELIKDPSANRWADGPNNLDFAFEVCDAPEGDVYETDGVSLSNFVTEDFFDPEASTGTKLDFLQLVKDPFETRPFGYQTIRTEPGKESQVFAHHNGKGNVIIVMPGIVLACGAKFEGHKVRYKFRKARQRGRKTHLHTKAEA